MERVTGYQAQELIGQVVHDKIHQFLSRRESLSGERMLVGRGDTDAATRARRGFFVRKDGTFFPVRYSASPVFRDSVPVGAVIEVQDLTETKAAEEEVTKTGGIAEPGARRNYRARP